MKKYIGNVSILAVLLVLTTNSSKAFCCCRANEAEENQESDRVFWGPNFRGILDILGEDEEQRNDDVRSLANSMVGKSKRAALLDADIALSAGDVDARSRSTGNTRLTHAALMGDVELVAMLLERKANINAVTIKGKTALMHASRNGRDDIVALLLRHGADINAQDAKGRSALVFAVIKSEEKDIVRRLIMAGSDCSLIRPESYFMRGVRMSDEMRTAIEQFEQERRAIERRAAECEIKHNDFGDSGDEKMNAEHNGPIIKAVCMHALAVVSN